MFKQLKDLLGEYVIPVDRTLYDGVIDKDNTKIKLYAKDFICSMCNGTDCGVCPDCNGKKYLMCLNPYCAWDIAEYHKNIEREAFKRSLIAGMK